MKMESSKRIVKSKRVVPKMEQNMGIYPFSISFALCKVRRSKNNWQNNYIVYLEIVRIWEK